jgi:hypothetical protein
LDGPCGPRMAGVLVADRRVIDGEGVVVGAGRALSRHVVHSADDSATRRTLSSVIPKCKNIGEDCTNKLAGGLAQIAPASS